MVLHQAICLPLSRATSHQVLFVVCPPVLSLLYQESKQRSMAPPPSHMLAQQSGKHCPFPWDLLQRWHSSAPPWKPISVVLLFKTEIYMLPLPQVIAVPLSILFVKVHVKYVWHYYYYYSIFSIQRIAWSAIGDVVYDFFPLWTVKSLRCGVSNFYSSCSRWQ